MLSLRLTLRVLLAVTLPALWLGTVAGSVVNADPADEPRLEVVGLSDKAFMLTDANLTPSGGEIKQCEPRTIWVLYRGKAVEDALAPFGYKVSATRDGNPVKVKTSTTGVLSATRTLFQMSYVLDDPARPGSYVLTLTPPTDEYPPLEVAVRFTC